MSDDELRAAAERVMENAANDAMERFNGGSPSQRDQDCYVVAHALLDRLPVVATLTADLARAVSDRAVLLEACIAIGVALNRYGAQIEALFGHDESFARAVLMLCDARNAVKKT